MKLIPTLILAVALTATGTVAAQSSDAAGSNDRAREASPTRPSDDSPSSSARADEETRSDTESLRGRSSFARLTAEEIRQMQELLKAQGYYEETVDGIAGPQTRSAIRRFQRAQRLPVTGELDRGTALALGMDESVAPVSGTREERPTREARDANEGTSTQQPGSIRAPSAETIRGAQEKLESMGYRPGEADGILGRRTRAAIRSFQEANDLPVNGQLDDATLRALGMSVEADRDQRGAREE